MRILQWAFPHTMPLGGKEIFTERLSKSFSCSGHQVLLMADSLTEDSPLHTFSLLSENIEIHRLNLAAFGRVHSKDSSQTLRGEIKEVIDRFAPDIIHYHNFYSKSLVFLSAYMRSASRKIPIVYTVHDIETLSKIPPALSGEVIGNLTDVIICPSQYIEKRFAALDGLKSKRVMVIENGVPNFQGKSENSATGTPKKLQILAAANFENHKGLIILLTAWSQIQKDFSGVKLIIAGDGKERDFLLNFTQKLGIQSSVIFPGWMSEKQLQVEFSEDTIVVVPSLIAEAFGLIAAEGQMAGLPVIASNIGGLIEIIAHDETGFLVPPGSVRALSSSLIQLLTNEPMRKKMGDAGRRRAVELFDLEVCASKYLDLFRSLSVRK